MNENQVEAGRFTEGGHGLGTVTQAMVLHRAREIALINGRSSHHVLDTDLNQARRELTGQERLTPPLTAGETLLEESRWDPIPESVAHQAPTVSPPDEQTFAEELVEEGVEEAEHDQMVKATRESLRRDRQR
jgi:hypothetical protein